MRLTAIWLTITRGGILGEGAIENVTPGQYITLTMTSDSASISLQDYDFYSFLAHIVRDYYLVVGLSSVDIWIQKIVLAVCTETVSNMKCKS